MIWDCACEEPRLVIVALSHLLDPGLEVAMRHSKASVRYSSHTANPQILFACQESRAIGLKHYSSEFGVRWTASPARATIHGPGNIFVNWERDIICPDVSSWIPHLNREFYLWDFMALHPKVQKIALSPLVRILGTTQSTLPRTIHLYYNEASFPWTRFGRSPAYLLEVTKSESLKEELAILKVEKETNMRAVLMQIARMEILFSYRDWWERILKLIPEGERTCSVGLCKIIKKN